MHWRIPCKLPYSDWVHKRNKSKKCCSMLNVLSWLRALKSHTLSVRLTQTNSFLHSHAKAIIPHSYKVLHLFCWFWDSKLLLSLRTYKIILPNIIYWPCSLCTHFAHFLTAKILSQIKEMHNLAILFFYNFPGEHAPIPSSLFHPW